MKNRNQKIAKVIAFSMIAVMGFRDTGVFVNDFSVDKEAFNSGQKVEIIQETDRDYLVMGKDGNLEVPKSNMIKEGKADFTYEVKESTEIKNQIDNTSFRKLRKGEVVDAIYLEGDTGIFKTQDGITGVVNINNLKQLKEETITKGTAQVDKVLKNNNGNTFIIKRGNVVKVTGYENDKYEVIDMEGNKYLASKEDITMGDIQGAPSRGKSILNQEKGNGKLGNLIANAKKEIGKPYISGDIGRRGYDCSGFTFAMFSKTFGMKLPRTSGGQASAGTYVKKSDLQPGDLVFFRTNGKNIAHVGLYIGNGNMIHASTGQRRMTTTSIHTNYFAQRYVTARRVIK